MARAYIRLSRLRDGEEKLSPDIQLDVARTLCKLNGWELDEDSSTKNSDLDVSGFTTHWKDRPGLAKHFEEAKKGLFQRLIVSAIDRLGRNGSDTINCWDEFENHGVSLYADREKLDTSTVMGVLLRNILASVAEIESQNTSARIKANVVKRAQLGRLHGGRLPFWLERNDEKTIVVREEEAQMIRYAVALRLSGQSYVAVTRAINLAGYRTRSTNKRYERSFITKFLQKSDWIDGMLGHAWTRRDGRYATDPRTGRRVSRGTPIKIPNVWPPILDEVTAAKLVLMRHDAKRIAKDSDGVLRRERVSEKWMLNGLAFCAECGGRLGVHLRKQASYERRTYFCEAHNNDPTAKAHQRSRVDADLLEMAVLTLVSYELRVAVKNSPIPPKPPRRRRTIRDIDGEMGKIVELYSRGTLPIEVLDRKVEALKAEREEIQLEELNAVASTGGAVPQLLEGTSRSQVRELLRQLHLKITYPIFLEEITNPANPRTGKRSLKPCVQVEWGQRSGNMYWQKPLVLAAPIYRMEFAGTRRIISISSLPSSIHIRAASEPDIAFARTFVARS